MNKGKRKISELNYDDSSDSDYQQPDNVNESSEESDMLADNEVLSQEDVPIARKMKKNVPSSVVVDENWYSEVDGKSDLESLDDEFIYDSFYNDETEIRDMNLTVGMKFASAQVFREVLRDWCIKNGNDIDFIRNENTRITAKCKKEDFNWRIHTSPIMNSKAFQIKTIKGNHTCLRSYDNSLAKAKYLAKRMEDAIRDNPNIPVDQLKNTIMRECKVDVSRWKVMRAKKEAIDAIRGVDALQYKKLRDYCETVRAKNQRSKIILRRQEGSNPAVFDRLYYNLIALELGFLEGCRPIIGLDGCFLQTVYQRQLLVAVGRDGNDNMIPIALAVVQLENRDNWSWFISEWLEDIGALGTDRWSFISDRQKGLVEDLKELAPKSEHRYCIKHMYENFKRKFKGAELKEYFWKAASIANKQEFSLYEKDCRD
ncbi:UNVERIFIED_CONTAM: hypothetical protein Sradi_3004100 [Sesamum radiatum]|uniref:MULE transposase domain-containing protein n=1 Tax=Sesamum radiatum TaxID=300843 RepID=A0AAW2S0X1_SESRA